MKQGRLIALLASAAVLWPAAAGAETATIGPAIPATAKEFFHCEIEMCPRGQTLAQLYDLTDLYEATAPGRIIDWRVLGSAGLRLRVLHEEPGGERRATGTSAPSAGGTGPNPTSLPIRSGDVIGVDQPETADTEVFLGEVGEGTSVLRLWSPALAENALEPALHVDFTHFVLLVDADIAFTPVVSSVSPSTGGSAGGNAVKISGESLDGSTSVTFGSTPASSFSVDSLSQITAIAPPSAAGTVDVHVTGPGGTSEVSPADRYTFTPSPPAPVTPMTLVPIGPAAPVLVKPAVSGFSQSSAKWKRGSSLPHISSTSPPVGTTFAFNLNEPAAASLAFTRQVSGRRVEGKCVAVTRANAGKRKCKRTVSAGSLPFTAHAGSNKVRFQGRLSSVKRLAPGSYDVALTVRDSHGLKASTKSLSFTIVSG